MFTHLGKCLFPSPVFFCVRGLEFELCPGHKIGNTVYCIISRKLYFFRALVDAIKFTFLYQKYNIFPQRKTQLLGLRVSVSIKNSAELIFKLIRSRYHSSSFPWINTEPAAVFGYDSSGRGGD